MKEGSIDVRIIKYLKIAKNLMKKVAVVLCFSYLLKPQTANLVHTIYELYQKLVLVPLKPARSVARSGE